MYQKILVTLENTPTDRIIIEHIKQLATTLGSSVVLLHVATGVAAQWNRSNAGGEEVHQDSDYLKTVRAEFMAAKIPTTAELAFGDPVTEIVKWIAKSQFNLIAMSTHGHRLVADLILGSTASRVQHSVSVPVLLLRAK